MDCMENVASIKLRRVLSVVTKKGTHKPYLQTLGWNMYVAF
jgi:hypothetical protein